MQNHIQVPKPHIMSMTCKAPTNGPHVHPSLLTLRAVSKAYILWRLSMAHQGKSRKRAHCVCCGDASNDLHQRHQGYRVHEVHAWTPNTLLEHAHASHAHP